MKGFPSVAVFLGPSLPKSQACQILDAHYYPPAGKGDIYRILTSGLKAIILIDGVFHSRPSVWHRELVNAMEEGIQVFGASSMGALRAAELEAFGMVGHGTIFEWYRDGLLESDDEVALLHGPEELGFVPMSEPLVNIRYTLLKAVEENYITTEEAQDLLEYARQLYYPERSYQQLLKSPTLKDFSEEKVTKLEYYLLNQSIDLKKIDAMGVLKLYASFSTSHTTERQGRFSVPSLDLQVERLKMTGFVSSKGIVTGKKIGQALQEDGELQARMRSQLSKQCFLLTWAKQNEISFPPEEWPLYLERWRQRYDIVDEAQWLQSNGLTPLTYRELLEEYFLIEWMVKQGPDKFGIAWNYQTALAAELQLNSLTPGWVDAELSSEHGSLQGLQRHQTHSWGDQPKENWTQLSQRGFILEWSRQNGITCPDEQLETYIQDWETAHQISDRTKWLQTHNFTLQSYRTQLAEKAWEAWVIKQEPHYFGIPWSFVEALFKELQITGQTAKRLANLS